MKSTKQSGRSVRYIAAAIDILQRDGSMPFNELFEAVANTPEFEAVGKTPRNSLYSMIWRDVRRDDPRFRMSRNGRGEVIVGLTERGKRE